MEKLYVIKIGGNIIENPSALENFLRNFSTINYKKILIHGGGKDATKTAEDRGIEQKFNEGRRITDSETLKIVDIVYTRLNRSIIDKLSELGCPSKGFTGLNDKAISATKRAPLNDIDYGFVGDISQVNGDYLSRILKDNETPVLSPLVYSSETGYKLNTNADTIAFNVSKSLTPFYEVHLVYCFELKGVLENFEDKDSVIPEIIPTQYNSLKEKGIISKGMIPKLDNSFDAINAGVTTVRICHANDLIGIINNGDAKGTILKN